jgi:beta-glucosidase/6-phospho-beta-glucosidase/beta-galactosidase
MRGAPADRRRAAPPSVLRDAPPVHSRLSRRSFLAAAPVGLAAALAACSRPSAVIGALAPRRAAPTLLFATGIENSYPRMGDGTRVDQMDASGHSTRWREDFELARNVGVHALRYGPAWYRTNPAPGRYDWSSADEQMQWLRASGLTVIADLCHFGTPDWIGGFQDPSLPVHHAEYARAFAQRYPWVRHYTPVNEIFVAANFSAMLGWWNECLTDRVAFARALRNLSLAHELAVKSILEVRGDAIIVQAESIEHFEPADQSASAAAEAAFWNAARFAALDLTLGREPAPEIRALLAEGGMTAADYDFFRQPRAAGRRWIGVDYYATSEQVVCADGGRATAPQRAGLATVAGAYHARYGLPLFVTETSRESGQAVQWLAEQWEEVQRLAAADVPIVGFTWFPLIDTVDWQHALRIARGDVDRIGLHGLDRTPHAVASAYAALIASAGRTPLVATSGVRRGLHAG